ncbi:MAG TPA: Yip1 family protein [Sphingomonadaceae bacterium]|nr:Yip1 family protein [Sphingomonadaceae bacterium]
MTEHPLSRENLAAINDRAKAIISDPRSAWPQIAEERLSTQEILLDYVLPLAAIGPVAGLIGGQLLGYGFVGLRIGLGAAIGMAVTSYLLSILSVFLIAFVANFLSPRFGGNDDFASAFKLCAYAMTAAWLAGVFALVPVLAILGFLGLYSIYLFYTGVAPMMGIPADRALTYTAITILVALVVNLVISSLATGIGGMPPMMI